MSLYTGSVISWKTLRWFFSHHYISSYKDTLYWGPTVSAADNLWVEVIKKTAYTKNWLSQTCRLCWKERVITYFQVLQLQTAKLAKQRKNTQFNRYIFQFVCLVIWMIIFLLNPFYVYMYLQISIKMENSNADVNIEYILI